MEVYIVTEGEYSDYHIVGVFSTIDLARKITKEPCGVDRRIEVYKLNSSLPKNPVFRVIIKPDGEVEFVYNMGLFGAPENDTYIIKGRSDKPLSITCRASSESHAVKIANERRAAWLALGKWS